MSGFLNDPVPDDDVLPCGCVIRYSVEAGVRTMTVAPCRQSCRNLAIMLGLADEMGRPVERRMS